MQIISFPAHYQSVYTNFDISSFSLISCPANYFKLDNKIIFIASKADELTVGQKRVKIYNRYTDSMTTEKYINACWLIRIQKNIGLSEIVSTNVKNFVGIKQLKGTKFKAPVSDRRLKE